jgi:pimeloyl-ACP methyl ester carboxylesterase
MWRRVSDQLAERWRVVVVDLPGFGCSATVAGATVDDMADRVLDRLDLEGIASAAVVGVSLGGYVALSMALRRPARVGALLLLHTRAESDTAEAQAGRDLAIEQLRNGARAAWQSALLDRLVAPQTPAAVRHDLAALASAQPLEALLSTLTALKERPDRTPALSTLAVPTLCLAGELDAVTPPATLATLQRGIPGAILTTLTACGHLSPVEQPAACAAAIEQFLSTELTLSDLPLHGPRQSSILPR